VHPHSPTVETDGLRIRSRKLVDRRGPRATFLALPVATLFFCSAAFTQGSEPITVKLSLEYGRGPYKIGEPILLDLTFLANEPGYSVNMTTTEPASPVDTLVLTPMIGVFPWLDHQARGQRYAPDYSAVSSLVVSEPQTVVLPLNAVYRFDSPGHYTVQVITGRAEQGDVRNLKRLAPLTTNSVSFDVEPMSQKEEADRAAEFEARIRRADNRQDAQRYANDLDWLTGDPSTRVKLSLFLNPKTFYPFAVDVSQGLWIARDRKVVVEQLEQALRDPRQPLPAGSPLLQTAVALKARLLAPFDPALPGWPLQTQSIEAEYLKQIAGSLSQRTDEALLTAAQTAFVQLAQRKEVTGPEFAAAREVLITHFAAVNEYNVDWLLNAYGQYLLDKRIVPPLQQILDSQHDPIFNLERTAVLKQLARLNAEHTRADLVAEICAGNPTLLQNSSDIYVGTLPEIDDCVKEMIHAAVSSGKRLNLEWGTEFAAHFATPAISDDLLRLYQDSGSTWDASAKGYLLAYVARWDSQRGLPLLESALPANAPELDFNILYSLNRAYSPALETFWRERLSSALPGQAGYAAWGLAQNGPPEDQALIRARLVSWRIEWKGRRAIPEPQARLEAELVTAVINGKNWKTSDSDVYALRADCLSAACRERIPKPR